MTVDANTRDLIADCLARIKSGDACAPMHLAVAFMSHVDVKDVGLNLALVEALATIAKNQGCPQAREFLQDEWAETQAAFGRRWQRAGFT